MSSSQDGGLVAATRKRSRGINQQKQKQQQPNRPLMNVSTSVNNSTAVRKYQQQQYHGSPRISKPLVVAGLGLAVVVVTWMIVQVMFWMQRSDENMQLHANSRNDNINPWKQHQRIEQAEQPNNNGLRRSSSKSQLVETPAFHSDFGGERPRQKDPKLSLKTKTKTTTTLGGMTWNTLSFSRETPEYRPTQRYSDIISTDGSISPVIHGLKYETPPDLHTLPKWVRDYVVWHASVRKKYPKMDLFTHPDAPPLLVRTCLGLCGGLHDRIGQLPWDLYLAAKTKRVLLIAWQRPQSLEYFLQPALLSSSSSFESNTHTDEATSAYDGIALDWTVPKAAKFGFMDIKLVRSNVTELFAGYKDSQPTGDFFNTDFDVAIERATTGEFSKIKILRHRLLGHLHQDVLEERLLREGWYKDDRNSKPSDMHRSPTFGRIFHLFFRPSDAVHELVVNTMAELGLLVSSSQEQQQQDGASSRVVYEVDSFHAVHCRVRHPKAHAKGQVVKGKNENYPADKTGLPWEPDSPTRQFAVDTAQIALQCAHDVIAETTKSTTVGSNGNNRHGRIYFLADSNDLVRHVASELHDPIYLSVNASQVSSNLLQTINELDTIESTPVARNVDMETAHIDRQKGRPPPDYYATLVDLYIAMHAQCVVYGIGYYAAFAAKISGTPCQYLYAIEEWGVQTDKRAKGTGADDTTNGVGAHQCPNVVNTGTKQRRKTNKND
jgi:hypothetical protein